MNKLIAIYLRLSRDDDDNDDESNSISSQRSIIKNHISSDDELRDKPVMEFKDDGYSGTNLERPGVKHLLDAVRRGEISCVIVKDLSRFGRNYLEVSKLIELVFPYLGVRFIAINDRYDSNNHIGTTADVDVAFRNLINALYSRDISKKVKTAKRTKALKGMNINAFALYGYKKSAEDKHRLEIDEPAAEVVKRIFSLYCEGQRPTQIARVLNADGVLTPSEYKKKNGSNLKVRSTTGALWSNSTVNRILLNEQYLGTYIFNKVETGEIGSRKVIHKPKEEWTKVPNAHPAIITDEIWNTVHQEKSLADISSHKKPNHGRMLYKKVLCGYCGHIMRYRQYANKRLNKVYKYYCCETPRYSDEFGCTSKAYNSQAIEDAVKDAVKKQLAFMLNIGKMYRDGKKAIKKKSEEVEESANLIDIEIERLTILKQQIYERYKLGKINEEEHMRQREEVVANINIKKLERTALISDNQKQNETINNAHQFFIQFEEYKDITDPTDKLVNSMVEAVYVFDVNRLEIKFIFSDEIIKMESELKSLMKVKEFKD